MNISLKLTMPFLSHSRKPESWRKGMERWLDRIGLNREKSYRPKIFPKLSPYSQGVFDHQFAVRCNGRERNWLTKECRERDPLVKVQLHHCPPRTIQLVSIEEPECQTTYICIPIVETYVWESKGTSRLSLLHVSLTEPGTFSLPIVRG